MFRCRVLSAAAACVAIAAATTGIHASGHERTLVVTMTNDQNANQIKVYTNGVAILSARVDERN